MDKHGVQEELAPLWWLDLDLADAGLQIHDSKHAIVALEPIEPSQQPGAPVDQLLLRGNPAWPVRRGLRPPAPDQPGEAAERSRPCERDPGPLVRAGWGNWGEGACEFRCLATDEIIPGSSQRLANLSWWQRVEVALPRELVDAVSDAPQGAEGVRPPKRWVEALKRDSIGALDERVDGGWRERREADLPGASAGKGHLARAL